MFSLNDVPETKEMSFTLLPKGGYRVLVSKCEHKYKDGSVHSGSSWFALAFDVIPYHGHGEYEFAGRKAFVNLTWENKNPQAMEIGRSIIADLMFAVGIPSFSSPGQLATMILNRELFIEVDHKPRKDRPQEMELAIKGYWNAQTKLQRKKNPKPVPPPPTPESIASAPAQAPRSGPAVPQGHPAFEEAPF